MTRAMGHSPNGQDPQGLGAKPEWPGLANGEMRPTSVAMTNLTQRTLSMVSLEDDIVQSFEHAMIFKSFLDSLCAGVSAMPQDAARSAALRAEPQSASQAKPAAAIARDAR